MKKLLLLLLLTASVGYSQKVAFLGTEADVASLIDDDAKTAATWMQTNYGATFKYIQISSIDASQLSDVTVAVLYYLTPSENVGYSATPTDVSTMLPSALQAGTSQTIALTNWVKAGGDMLIAGDPTPFVFTMGRVSADFTQLRAAGNYVYSEFGCASSSGCVDTGKPADDIWGLGMRDANNSGNRRNDPIFNGLTFTNGDYLSLQNSPTREVRLIWWQHFDNILSPSCCGQDAALFFEQKMAATKYGTLRHIGDSFGYGAVLFNPTNGVNDVNFDTQIPTDFAGRIMTIQNTIVGYEWNSNGTTNDFQSNIEKFTANIIAFLSDNTITLSTDKSELNAITVYPNPANNYLIVTKGNIDNLSLNLYDLNGKIVLNKKIDNNPINISNLSSGLFFAEIKDEKGVTLKTVKVLKN